MFVHETPSTALLDGNEGLGLVVGPAAMCSAIKKAAAVTTGWVAVKNSIIPISEKSQNAQ